MFGDLPILIDDFVHLYELPDLAFEKRIFPFFSNLILLKSVCQQGEKVKYHGSLLPGKKGQM
jgi:hypothetical protein